MCPICSNYVQKYEIEARNKKLKVLSQTDTRKKSKFLYIKYCKCSPINSKLHSVCAEKGLKEKKMHHKDNCNAPRQFLKLKSILLSVRLQSCSHWYLIQLNTFVPVTKFCSPFFDNNWFSLPPQIMCPQFCLTNLQQTNI